MSNFKIVKTARARRPSASTPGTQTTLTPGTEITRATERMPATVLTRAGMPATVLTTAEMPAQ
jgi:hypothetical protein